MILHNHGNASDLHYHCIHSSSSPLHHVQHAFLSRPACSCVPNPCKRLSGNDHPAPTRCFRNCHIHYWFQHTLQRRDNIHYSHQDMFKIICSGVGSLKYSTTAATMFSMWPSKTLRNDYSLSLIKFNKTVVASSETCSWLNELQIKNQAV